MNGWIRAWGLLGSVESLFLQHIPPPVFLPRAPKIGVHVKIHTITNQLSFIKLWSLCLVAGFPFDSQALGSISPFPRGCCPSVLHCSIFKQQRAPPSSGGRSREGPAKGLGDAPVRSGCVRHRWRRCLCPGMCMYGTQSGTFMCVPVSRERGRERAGFAS